MCVWCQMEVMLWVVTDGGDVVCVVTDGGDVCGDRRR